MLLQAVTPVTLQAMCSAGTTLSTQSMAGRSLVLSAAAPVNSAASELPESLNLLIYFSLFSMFVS